MAREPWLNIPTSVLDRDKTEQQADAWRDQQRAKITDAWARAHKAALTQTFDNWQRQARTVMAPAQGVPDVMTSPPEAPGVAPFERGDMMMEGERTAGGVIPYADNGEPQPQTVSPSQPPSASEPLAIFDKSDTSPASQAWDDLNAKSGLSTTAGRSSSAGTEPDATPAPSVLPSVKATASTGTAAPYGHEEFEQLRDNIALSGTVLPPDPRVPIDLERERELQAKAEPMRTRPVLGPTGMALFNPAVQPFHEPERVPNVDLYGIEGKMPTIGEVSASRTQRAAEMAPKGEPINVAGEVTTPSILPATASPETPPIAPPFYSQLARTIDEKMPAKASARDLIGLLRNSPVKPDEMKWTGLDDYLHQKALANETVTKADIQEFLRQHEVQVQEVAKGNANEFALDQVAMKTQYDYAVEADRLGVDSQAIERGMNGDVAGLPEQLRPLAMKAYQAERAAQSAKELAGPLKWSAPNLNLPGGENPRELLLTLPKKEVPMIGVKPITPEYQAAAARYQELNVIGDAGQLTEAQMSERHRLEYTLGLLDPYRDIQYGPNPNYQSSHWGEPNVLAHVRVDDRTTPDGKKMLFVQELQSDWATAARERGFVGQRPEDEARLGAVKQEMAGLQGREGSEARIANLQKEQMRLEERLTKGSYDVPAAPFVDSPNKFTALAMKRIIRWAAENGYDSVGWTTGAQQNARYNLAKFVDAIDYIRTPEGSYQLTGTKSDGSVVFSKHVRENQLVDAVGQEMANSIIRGYGERRGRYGNVRRLSGTALELGGSGMKGAYDEIMPAVATQIGKKFGARPGMMEIATDSPVWEDPYSRVFSPVNRQGQRYGPTFQTANEALAYVREHGEMPTPEPIHYMDITPQMRQSVVHEGQSLFAAAPGAATGLAPQQEGESDEDYQRRQQLGMGAAVVGALGGQRNPLGAIQRAIRGPIRAVPPMTANAATAALDHMKFLADRFGVDGSSWEQERATMLGSVRWPQGTPQYEQSLTGIDREVAQYIANHIQQALFDEHLPNIQMEVDGLKEYIVQQQGLNKYLGLFAAGTDDASRVPMAVWQRLTGRQRPATSSVVETINGRQFIKNGYGLDEIASRAISEGDVLPRSGERDEDALLRSLRQYQDDLLKLRTKMDEWKDLHDANVVTDAVLNWDIPPEQRPSGQEPSWLPGRAARQEEHGSGPSAAGGSSGAGAGPGQVTGEAAKRLAKAVGTTAQQKALRPDEPGHVTNILLSQFPSDVHPLLQKAADDFSQFAGQRRGVIPDEQLLREAAGVAGVTSIEKWLKTDAGRAFNPEQAYALGQTLSKSGQGLDALVASKAANPASWTLEQEAALAQKSMEYAGLASVFSGARAEWGRVGRVFQMALDGANASAPGDTRQKFIQQALKALGGGEQFENWVREFSKIDPSDAVARAKMMESLYTPSLYDKVNFWRYASMLSGWKTHLANIASNTGETFARPLETLIAGYPREAAADIVGIFQGIPDGIAAASHTLETGMRTDQLTKMENVRPRAIGGLAGRIIAFPLDAMQAADEFFKAVNYSGVAHAEAYRMAGGDATKMAELLQNQPPELVKRAAEAGRYATFTNELDRTTQQVLNLTNTPTAAGMALKLFLPFVRTPANILYRGTRMLVKPVTGPVNAALLVKAGDPREARLELARAAIASTFLLGFAAKGMAGELTGSGPRDTTKRQTLEATGWQAHSIKIGGRWIDYNNLGPVSVPLAAVGGYFDAMRENQKPDANTPLLIAQNMGRSLSDISYLQNLGDLFKLTQGDFSPHTLERMAATQAGSFLPVGSFLASAERTIDPTIRSNATVPEALGSRIPFVSSRVPAEPDVYGQPRQTEPDILANIVLPWRSSPERNDAVANEVGRLIQAGQGVNVRRFEDKYANAQQTEDQRRLIQTKAGQVAHGYIAEFISTPAYQKLPDPQKAKTLNEALGTAYELVDRQLGDTVSRDPRGQALMAWYAVPQYEGIKGTPEQIRVQNFTIAQAKAKLVEYRNKYGDKYEAEYHLEKDDKGSYRLSQRPKEDARYLADKKALIDKRFNGALTQAQNQGLLGAGNTVFP